MRHAYIRFLLAIIVFMGVFPLAEAATWSRIDSLEARISASFEFGVAIPTKIETWYQRNNIPVSFLPELPPVHKVDAIMLLFGISLFLWAVLRFLSK